MRKIIALFVLLCSVTLLTNAQTEFPLLTDLHVRPGNENEKALELIVNEINQSEYPFVIVTGDLTNEGSDEELLNIKRVLDQLTIPCYVIPGNHEVNWSQSAGKTFVDLWGNDRFAFKKGDQLFVGFSCGPYMKMGDGHVKREDVLWLEKTLKEQATPGTKVYAFAHYPLTEDLCNWQEIVSILKKYNTIVSFCGHGHNLKELAFGDLKGIMCRATFTRGGTVPGYNIINLATDSVFVNEKLLGKDKIRTFAFANDASSHMTYEPKKEPVYEQPGNLTLVYQDDATVFTGVSADKHNLYFGNSLGEVKAVSFKNGKESWSHKTGSSLFSTPVCEGKRVIAPGADGTLYCLKAKNGATEWTIETGEPFVADGVIADGKLYQGGYKKFYKIDIPSAKIEWKFDGINNYCQALPVLKDNKVIFGAWDTNLYCLDARNGEKIWKWNNGSTQNMLSPGNCVPAVTDKQVIVVAPDRFMTAIDLKDGKQLWRSKEYPVRESMGMSADETKAYAKLMDGRLLAVSASDPEYKVLWCIDAGLGYEHVPCPLFEYKGVIYMGSRTGMVVAVDAATQQVLWRYKCGNSSVNRFDVGENGDLFFSLVEGKIYRIKI